MAWWALWLVYYSSYFLCSRILTFLYYFLSQSQMGTWSLILSPLLACQIGNKASHDGNNTSPARFISSSLPASLGRRLPCWHALQACLHLYLIQNGGNGPTNRRPSVCHYCSSSLYPFLVGLYILLFLYPLVSDTRCVLLQIALHLRLSDQNGVRL